MRKKISLCISGVLVLSLWLSSLYYGAETVMSYCDKGVFNTNPVRIAITLIEAVYLTFWWNRGWREMATKESEGY